jgi:hypothetical protein
MKSTRLLRLKHCFAGKGCLAFAAIRPQQRRLCFSGRKISLILALKFGDIFLLSCLGF